MKIYRIIEKKTGLHYNGRMSYVTNKDGKYYKVTHWSAYKYKLLDDKQLKNAIKWLTTCGTFSRNETTYPEMTVEDLEVIEVGNVE